MFTYFAAGASDVGLRRSNNEDAFLVRSDLGVLAVADGMGGAAAGEVASAIFVDAAGELFDEASPVPAEAYHALVQDVFRLANERMIAHIAKHPDHRGMGCTAELLVLSGDRYIVGHVGDSRTYLFRAGELRQVTKDHSLVQQQVDQGLISAQQARTHAMKNIVLRALGANLELSLDLVRGRVLPNDLFLLCSDGLSDMLPDDTIREIISSRREIPEMVNDLIEGAKAAGGKDNVTVVLCQAGS